MKNKVIWVFSLVLFVLVSCTLLSLRIEELMTPRVTKTGVGFDNPIVSLDALFVDEQGFHVYRTEEGTGWETGLRGYEINPSAYSLTEDGIMFSYGGGTSIVQYSTRQPRDGEIVSVIEKTEKGNDAWIITSPLPLPEVQSLPENYYRTVCATENHVMIECTDVIQPFMPDRAKSAAFGAEAVLMDPAYNEYRAFSMNDLNKFFEQVILLGVLGALIILPVILWAFTFPYIKKPKEHLTVLIINGGAGLLCLAGLIVLLRVIELPPSLLPVNNILELDHYRGELGQAFSALETFSGMGDGPSAALIAKAASARMSAAAITIASVVLAAVAGIAERIITGRKRSKAEKGTA